MHLSADDLVRRSIAAFLERERRAAQLDIADWQDRYSARTPAELAAKVERGEVYSHPAWEELIEWQNLEAYLTIGALASQYRLMYDQLARMAFTRPIRPPRCK